MNCALLVEIELLICYGSRRSS